MTVVAYDGKTIAAERLITEGDFRVGYEKKILPWSRGVYACRGDVDDGNRFEGWLESRDKFKPGKEFEAMWTDSDKPGKVFYANKTLTPWVHPVPFAIGSGAPVATPLLWEGYTAVEAVKAACKYTTSCGGKIDTFEVK